MGGIPGLANLTSREEILQTAYLDNPSIERGNKTVPVPESDVNGNTLTIPSFYKRVYKLDDVVDVDYYVPGCPPAFDQVKAVLQAVVAGELPAKRLGGRGLGQGALRRLHAHEEREEDQALLPTLADHDRPRRLPARAGDPLRWARDPVGVRGALPVQRHSLPRLLRPAPKASSTRAPSCSAPSPQ